MYCIFFFNDTATTEIYTLSLHDALPICHVKHRYENSILRRAIELEVEGRGPVGRPKKTWSKEVEEDTRKLNIIEDMVKDSNSGGNSYHV